MGIDKTSNQGEMIQEDVQNSDFYDETTEPEDYLTYEEIIELEARRQKRNVELIASENYPSKRVLNACGSILTNKYAEGYPGKRYYGGCQNIDMIERKAINDACRLFNCKYANVQPHCGSSANQAVYRALIEKGRNVMGMDLGAGGHLTHGHKMSFSGQDYYIVSYGVDDNGYIDTNDFITLLYNTLPAMVIVGASSYSRTIDYKWFKDVLDDFEKNKGYRPVYMVDMAHVAGLVAAGLHPNPCDYADVVTSTTHKTLRGPRGGLILTNSKDIIDKVNKAVFPGIQGGPLEHIIAAKGICFEEATTDEFKEYAQRVIDNAKAFADAFIKRGYKVVSGGTDNHMFVLDVYNTLGLTGKEVETELDKINITVNKNQIPNDTLPPLKSSGIRIGTPAMTTRGWTKSHFISLVEDIDEFLRKVKSGENMDAYYEIYRHRIDLLTYSIDEKED